MDDEVPRFCGSERRVAKQAARERDIARVRSGEISAEEINQQNGFFSALDRSKVRVAQRRVRVRLDI